MTGKNIAWNFGGTIIQSNDEAQTKIVAQLSAELRAEAMSHGVTQAVIIGLAQRVNPDIADFENARKELAFMVETAIAVQRDGHRGHNAGADIDAILAKVAELSLKGQNDEAAGTIDREFARWQQAEVERQESARQQGLALIEAGIQQDILRRNLASAARRLGQKVDIEVVDPSARFGVLRKVQDEYFVLGRDKGIGFDLEISIEIARLCIAGASNAHERGIAYRDLGNALRSLGERETGTARLEKAVTAYREALKDLTHEQFPDDWGSTKNSLGNALSTLGDLSKSTNLLEEAVVAFGEALTIVTREQFPLKWAATQNNLGNALQKIGGRETGTAKFEEAMCAYRNALNAITRDNSPRDWAMFKNNLGKLLNALGGRDGDAQKFKEAVIVLREAMEVWTRENFPLLWAKAQLNLGNALRHLGEHDKIGTAWLEEAICAYKSALEVISREQAPLGWADTQNSLGNALSDLGARESGTARLEEAVVAYGEALKEYSFDGSSLRWAMTQGNLAALYVDFFVKTYDRKVLVKALNHVDEALAVYRAANAEHDIGKVTALRQRILVLQASAT